MIEICFWQRVNNIRNPHSHVKISFAYVDLANEFKFIYQIIPPPILLSIDKINRSEDANDV